MNKANLCVRSLAQAPARAFCWFTLLPAATASLSPAAARLIQAVWIACTGADAARKGTVLH